MRLIKPFFLTVLAVALSCCQTASSVDPGALVVTPMGPIQGVLTQDDYIYNFKGIHLNMV